MNTSYHKPYRWIFCAVAGWVMFSCSNELQCPAGFVPDKDKKVCLQDINTNNTAIEISSVDGDGTEHPKANQKEAGKGVYAKHHLVCGVFVTGKGMKEAQVSLQYKNGDKKYGPIKCNDHLCSR